MKQMFDISEKLIAERSDQIFGVNTINWCNSAWKHLSLIGDEEVVSLLHKKVYVFSDSVLRLGKMSENPLPNVVWEDKLTWFKSSSQYRTLDTIDGEPMEIRVEYLPRIHHIAARLQSPRVPVKNESTTRRFHRRIIFVSMFNDISRGSQGKKARMRIKRSTRFDLCKKIFTRKRSGILLLNANHKENGTEL